MLVAKSASLTPPSPLISSPGTVSSSSLFSTSLPQPQLRFSTEFSECVVVGKGGYGEVFKVTNNLDGCEYAIKRIKLHDDEALNAKILREVRALSRLNHKYIVRYYQSWIEGGNTHNNTLTRGDVETSEDESFDNSSASVEHDHSLHFHIPRSKMFPGLIHEDPHSIGLFEFESDPHSPQNEDDFDDEVLEITTRPEAIKRTHSLSIVQKDDNLICHLCKLPYADWVVSHADWQLVDVRLQPAHLCEYCYIDHLKKSGMDTNNITLLRIPHTPLQYYLYIQMEYCDTTLRDLLDKNAVYVMKESELWNIFRQMTEAILYLHSQGFIHRDCKPSNVFVLKGKVKLGDFGLATVQCQDGEPEFPLNDEEVDSTCEDRTYDVGTYLYTAPEITESSKNYNEKVDMFSLGIILFELWHPFQTGMERIILLEKLRKFELPTEFRQNYPKQSDLILRLVDCDPKRRPSALELLNDLPKKNVGNGMGTHLHKLNLEKVQLQEENTQLRDRLAVVEEALRQSQSENASLKMRLMEESMDLRNLDFS